MGFSKPAVMALWAALTAAAPVVPAKGTMKKTPPDEAPAPAAVCKDGLDGLLEPFVHMGAFAADFVEEKHIALLLRPVTNKGRVYFMPPDSLIRRIEEPERSAVWLKGGSLRVRDADGEKAIDIGKWGPANVLVNSFLHVLRGDASSLEKHYRIDARCDASGAWTLTLSPKDPALGKLIKSMKLSGRGGEPLEIDMVDGHGDRQLTRFGRADRRVRLSDGTMKRLFSDPTAPR